MDPIHIYGAVTAGERNRQRLTSARNPSRTVPGTRLDRGDRAPPECCAASPSGSMPREVTHGAGDRLRSRVESTMRLQPDDAVDVASYRRSHLEATTS